MLTIHPSNLIIADVGEACNFNLWTPPTRFLSEVYCDAPSSPGNAQFVYLGLESPTAGGLYPYGSGFIYACLAGRRFEDGWTQKQVTCIDDGIWSEVGLTCDCESTAWNYTSS